MIVSYYNLNTGRFTGRCFDGENAEKIAPSGCGFVVGRYKKSEHCVDLSTGEVIALPDDEKAVFFNRKNRQLVIAQLSELDNKAMRYVAEKTAGMIDEEGERRLAAILERKAQLRQSLKHG
jgi:hypothetical protein